MAIHGRTRAASAQHLLWKWRASVAASSTSSGPAPLLNDDACYQWSGYTHHRGRKSVLIASSPHHEGPHVRD